MVISEVWFYIILFLICVLALLMTNLLNKRDSIYFEVPLLFTISIISGTRYYLGGTDYYIYKAVYDNLPSIPELVSNFDYLHSYYKTFGFETGYLVFNSFFKTIGLNFHGFTLAHSLIFFTLLYIGLKKYTLNFNLLIIVFLYKMFFYNTFISMRQSITIVIFFVAIQYIIKKQPWKYFTLCLIALALHNAALIMFPLYFLNKINITKRKILLLNLIFIPTIIISHLNLPVMKIFDFMIGFYENPVASDKARDLLVETPGASISLFHTLEYFLVMMIIIIFYEKIIVVHKDAKMMILLFLCLLPIFTMFSGYEIMTRIKDYFTITYAIILGYFCVIENQKYKVITQIFVVFLCAFGFFRFIYLFDNGAMYPYKSYIFEGISILY